ncbi:MAG: hypothetical protein ABI556_07185 [Gemmatimonadales bacterium]
MRHSALLWCAIVVVGCSKADTAADTAAVADTPVPVAAAEPTPMSLDQMAGKWNVSSRPTDPADTVATTYVLDAKADTAGWTIQFPTGAPIAMHIMSMAGDSLVAEAGPFDSRRVKGVKVHTIVTWRFRDGKLSGTTIAHYETKPPTTKTLISEGTKQ